MKVGAYPFAVRTSKIAVKALMMSSPFVEGIGSAKIGKCSNTIAFLTTYMRSPDIDDWRKLCDLIKYLRGLFDMPLTLGSNNGRVEWYVDALFATHPNMHGHTGGGLTIGRGFPTVTLTGTKIMGIFIHEAQTTVLRV
jgi:hypothetical protein